MTELTIRGASFREADAALVLQGEVTLGPRTGEVATAELSFVPSQAHRLKTLFDMLGLDGYDRVTVEDDPVDGMHPLLDPDFVGVVLEGESDSLPGPSGLAEQRLVREVADVLDRAGV